MLDIVFAVLLVCCSVFGAAETLNECTEYSTHSLAETPSILFTSMIIAYINNVPFFHSSAFLCPIPSTGTESCYQRNVSFHVQKHTHTHTLTLVYFFAACLFGFLLYDFFSFSLVRFVSITHDYENI